MEDLGEPTAVSGITELGPGDDDFSAIGDMAGDSRSLIGIKGKIGDICRPVISALTPANLHRCAIWGEGFEGLVPPACLKGRYFPNEKLPTLYASAKLILNDHHADMLREGFLNPRILDGLGSGGVVLSDALVHGREIFGDSVHWWHDPAELNQKIDFLLKDETSRKISIQAGIHLAKMYSFRALAERIGAHIKAHFTDRSVG
jgi:glycosyltransferase involved in cell wall biosynthesis